MATSYSKFDGSGSLRIEIEGEGGGNAYGTQLARALQLLAATVTSAVDKIPEEQRPQEVSLNCGLKALASGGFAIGLGTTTANFSLSLVWRNESAQGFPGESLMPSESELGL